MGKKKVIKQTTEEALKEREDIDSATKKATEKVSSFKRILRGKAYIQATYNNTIITLADERGNVLAWSSSGSLGFKGAKKATPYAATKVVETVVEKVRKSGLTDVDVFVSGIGSGRESAVRAIANKGLNILSIKDVTPIPHNGCRPKKVRRV